MNDSEEVLGGGYGAGFKKNLRKIYGAGIGFAGRGEMIPNADSYCEIDPVTVDQWGIPVLRFHFKWSQDEILQARHMQETFQQIIEGCGGKVTGKSGPETNWGIARGGEIIHEVGATRMGDDAKTSVLNQHSQAWIVRTCLSPTRRRLSATRIRTHADHYRARVAHVGLHRRRSKEAQP